MVTTTTGTSIMGITMDIITATATTDITTTGVTMVTTTDTTITTISDTKRNKIARNTQMIS